MTSPRSFLNDRVTLYGGDCLEVMASLPENSVDAIVTDPPYHLTSIVKRFGGDGSAPASVGETGAFARASAGFMGRTWDGGDIAFRLETWAATLRVLKPGGYLLAFASTRGFGRMSVAIEDAGFITHPFVAWIFGTGFPKATRIKADGYDGWRYGGQALKPAIEPIYMGQKPFSKATGTANILKWGTGALNIDGCRVEGGKTPAPVGEFRGSDVGATGLRGVRDGSADHLGRWPANLIHDGSDEVVSAFPDAPGQQRAVGPQHGAKASVNTYGDYGPRREFTPRLDAGSAARFFYSAKADKLDRIGSKHPTVKPVDLMAWLIRLVTPPGGLVLDPFAGSGSTGEAAWREGMRAVLIEREEEYQADIAERLRLADAGPASRKARAIKQADNDNLPLFGGAEAGGGGHEVRGGKSTDTSPIRTTVSKTDGGIMAGKGGFGFRIREVAARSGAGES